MGIVLGIIFIIMLIGGVKNEINKNKANAYLAKKYDNEKKKK